MFRLRLSLLGIRLGRPELIESDPAKLPPVESAPVKIGVASAHVLKHGPFPERGVEYAYELVRRHFDDSHARQAYFGIIGVGDDEHRFPEMSTVGPGCAVKYRTDDTGWGYRWWTRTGDKVVWQHDQWFNGDTMVSDRYYVPWRVRVDEACAHRTLGARWTEDYAKVDLSLTDPGDKKVVPVREEWTVEAVDDEVTVPAGTFRAIKLRSRRMDGDADAPLVSIYWFAPGVGKVKEDSDELEDLLEYHVEPEP